MDANKSALNANFDLRQQWNNYQKTAAAFHIESGWITPARHSLSPNHDVRPVNTAIDAIIIHGISLPPGIFGGSGIEELFSNRLNPSEHPYYETIHQFKVSSHLVIRRTSAVIQYVGFEQRAWHAGVSSLEGQERCNDFSIGIELEGCDDIPYTDKQYFVLTHIVTTLRRTYSGITEQRVIGHDHIAPGRKTDPGPAFDWKRLRTLMALAE
ncbi:MAG: 1,6-anhydro-N-acetylmuramyl-L-alanine amidase AmpD [Pseudomonadota bacterium]